MTINQLSNVYKCQVRKQLTCIKHVPAMFSFAYRYQQVDIFNYCIVTFTSRNVNIKDDDF